uniref:Dolichyl-phosphate beta-glucosyltransferase n=1 Tax=Rhabditophanes sp. KR3021 TaxID=114890 RepID=A0AC35U2Z7_9BILA
MDSIVISAVGIFLVILIGTPLIGFGAIFVLSLVTRYPNRTKENFVEVLNGYKTEKPFKNLLTTDAKASRLFTEPEVYLTVVVPAMNEEDRISLMLNECTEYLSERASKEKQFTYEIIVVDDGSRDKTSEIALTYSDANVSVLKLASNKGKGGAIRDGVLRSRGKLILFADADGATTFKDFDKLERKFKEMCGQDMKDDVDFTFPGLVVGSRAHLEAVAVAERSPFRTFLMKAFHLLVWALTVKTIQDTQCGFKLLSRSAVAKLFPLMHIERWAFDVELLYLAEQLHYPISEVAVQWKEIDGSKIVPVWSWLQMGRDILLIWFHYLTKSWTKA